MFKFHGYSGPCPKPTLLRPKTETYDLAQRVREFRRNQCEGGPLSDQEVVALIRAELEAVKQMARNYDNAPYWGDGCGSDIAEQIGERQR